MGVAEPALPTVRCGAAEGLQQARCIDAALRFVECQRQTQRRPAMRGQLRRALQELSSSMVLA